MASNTTQHPAACHLTVVLLCSGNGADSQSYRPRRDESQWWNRRDALVRCVASFLFGPNNGKDSRKLILLYDGDYSRIHMSLEKSRASKEDVVPSEFTIIALWKEALTKAVQAAPNPPPVVRKGRLSCWAVIANTTQKEKPGAAPKSKMIQDWNKRQLLEYLQKECSIEFLREHRLNSASSVILRKTNRGTLAKVYQAWIIRHWKSTKEKVDKSYAGDDPGLMQKIFQEILEPHKDDNLIAATLHESSDCELPCFGTLRESDGKPRHLCLFLGAVRDMISMEYRALESVCQSIGEVPLVKVRLGSVPEFTSKILSVVAFHHSQGKLGPAMKLLALQNSKKRDRETFEEDPSPTPTPQLHIIALVPILSDQVVIDLEKRDRTMWSLVRVLVCSLWRSRLVGGRNSTPLENAVTLVFLDGTYVTLQQREWVSSLAEQHQAAPSEYQVLQALIDQIQKKSKATTPSKDWKERALEITNDLLSNDNDAGRDVISIERGAPIDLVKRFYVESEGEASHEQPTNLCAVLPISSISSSTEETVTTMQKALLQAFQQTPSCRVSRQSIVEPPICGDWEASSIILLQHLFYQNRLFWDEALTEPISNNKARDNGSEGAAESKSKKKKRKHKKRRKEDRKVVN